MKVTIADIARESGVSIATVSRVINETKSVSPELRERVFAVIEKNRFKPNALAQGLVTKKSNMIGVIVSDISNVVFGSLTKGADRVCRKKGYTIMICESGGRLERELELFYLMEDRQVDGVLFAGVDVNQQLVDCILSRSYPTVLVTQETYVGNGIVNTVIHDNRAAMADAVRFLLNSGHERIAYVGGPKHDYSSGQQRLRGYRDALEEAGIDVTESYIVEGEFSYEAGFAGMKRIYEENMTRPTAAVTGSDVIALGAIHFLKNKGVDVPGEFSVMGFDDSDFATYFQPELSTVRVSYTDEGEMAARDLIRLIEGRSDGVKTRQVPYKIIQRDTVKAR